MLNVVFADSSVVWLLCPYDTDALPPAVIDEAQRSHPFIREGAVQAESTVCRDVEMIAAPFDDPLLDYERRENTKGRYKFPYGDFEKVHRCGVLADESRAGQYKYYDIELALAHLHGMLDALM